MARVTITQQIHPAVIARIKRSDGLQRDMFRRGVRVQTAARRRLGANPRRIDTGRLRNSISVGMEVVDGAWVARVGTNVEYAIFVHEGTRFMRANPFLRDALPAAAG